MARDKVYFGTNTKMYKTIAQTVEFLTELDRLTADLSREWMELFVIPSFTALESARRCVPSERITLGAQNMGWEDEGQFTGEISPLMLREVGTRIVEIGHSERRHVLGEPEGALRPPAWLYASALYWRDRGAEAAEPLRRGTAHPAESRAVRRHAGGGGQPLGGL